MENENQIFRTFLCYAIDSGQFLRSFGEKGNGQGQYHTPIAMVLLLQNLRAKDVGLWIPKENGLQPLAALEYKMDSFLDLKDLQ